MAAPGSALGPLTRYPPRGPKTPCSGALTAPPHPTEHGKEGSGRQSDPHWLTQPGSGQATSPTHGLQSVRSSRNYCLPFLPRGSQRMGWSKARELGRARVEGGQSSWLQGQNQRTWEVAGCGLSLRPPGAVSPSAGGSLPSSIPASRSAWGSTPRDSSWRPYGDYSRGHIKSL